MNLNRYLDKERILTYNQSVFFWFLIITTSNIEPDSVKIDSIKVRHYEIPGIVDFGFNGRIDSSLNQTRVIEPVIFLSGYYDAFFFTPYLLNDRGHKLEIKSFNPFCVLINSHSLDDYFIQNFNLSVLPINLLKSLLINSRYTGNGINSIDFKIKVNNYDMPYSYLYFTLLGYNTIYNLDFTRAVSDYAGFYFSGLYSNQYKNQDGIYLKTTAGCANFYFNKFIPMRLDVIYTMNSYDTVANTDFNDIAFVMGNRLYQILLFRTGFKVYNTKGENDYVTYGTNQTGIFYVGNFENIFGVNAIISKFKSTQPAEFKNDGVEFKHTVNYNYMNLTAGTGYVIDYMRDKIYFEPMARFKYEFSKHFGLSGRTGLFYKRADHIALYGNKGFVDEIVNINGDPEIKDEVIFHKEGGIFFKNSLINIYHSVIDNQIVYQPEGNDDYFAINIGKNIITGIEGIFCFPLVKNFSLMGVFNSILIADIPEGIPELFLRTGLNWQKKTERSMMEIFARFNFIGDRSDISGNSHKSFYTTSLGLNIKFITLNLSIIFDNPMDIRPDDYPEMSRNFGMEVKWEFWD